MCGNCFLMLDGVHFMCMHPARYNEYIVLIFLGCTSRLRLLDDHVPSRISAELVSWY